MSVSIEDVKPYIERLNAAQKEKLLLRLLKKDKVMLEQLFYKHVSSAEELADHFADFEHEVYCAVSGYYRAKSDELKMAKAIGEAKKIISNFTKVDKRPENEVALLMVILKCVFDNDDNQARLGTCWTRYDFSVAQTLKRVINLIESKLHEDCLLDYKP